MGQEATLGGYILVYLFSQHIPMLDISMEMPNIRNETKMCEPDCFGVFFPKF